MRYVKNIQKVTAEAGARRRAAPLRAGAAQSDYVIAPRGDEVRANRPKPRRPAPREPDPAEFKLCQRFAAYSLKRQSQLPLVNIQAFVLGGSLVDTEQTAGRSSLVGAMLDKGTAKFTAKQIADYFDSIGGKFSTAAGRNTVFANATVLAEDFPKAASLVAECFTKPTFPDKPFAEVKQLALGAIARRANNPQQQILEVFYDNLPTTSPYHLLQGGKTETVERLTAEDLRAYHAKYFAANNMIVTVFGDIDPDKALAIVQKNFGQVAPNPGLGPIDFDRPNAIPETIVRHKQIGKETGMVMIGYPGVSIRDKEDHAALVVLDAIMSGYSYPGGWLHNELRGQGLVYYVHAFQLTGPVPGYFAVLAQTQPDKIAEVVGRIEKNVARAKSGNISEEEFRTAVEMVLALHSQENTTIGEQARQAALDDLYGLGYAYDKSFDTRIEAVTLEDVVRVANKVFTNRVEVTASPAAKVKPE